MMNPSTLNPMTETTTHLDTHVTMTMLEDLQRIASAMAPQVMSAVMRMAEICQSPMNLDNLTADRTDMSEKENDMAKRHKTKIELDGETRWVTGATQQEVIIAAAKLLAQSQPHEDMHPKKRAPLFGECAWNWFEVYKAPKVRANTAYNYKRDMINHVLPTLGDRPIDEITATEIQTLFNSKREKSQSTVKHIWLIIHGVFTIALRDGHIEKDPTCDSKWYTMSQKKTRRDALTLKEVSDVIAQMERLKAEDQALLAVYIYTGVRRSEALGLRWEDIDFKRNLIYIERAVTFKDNHPVIGATKSEAGERYIPLDAKLKEALEPMRQISGFVFGQEAPITETKYKRTWERIKKTIDLHGATAHVFRHTYITMAASHIDIKTLQSIAGHADISTTMNRYAHGREDKIIAAGQVLQTMYL